MKEISGGTRIFYKKSSINRRIKNEEHKNR